MTSLEELEFLAGKQAKDTIDQKFHGGVSRRFYIVERNYANFQHLNDDLE